MSDTPARPQPTLLYFRVALGLLQGVALHLLLPHPGRMTPLDIALPGPVLEARGYVVAILTLCLTIVPPAIMLAMPVLSARRAAIWAGALCAILAGLAFYHVWRLAGGSPWQTLVATDLGPICGLGVFIAQSLLLAAVRDGHAIARYPAYFDVAWNQAVQIVLGQIFVVLLWLVLHLGAGLYEVIGLSGFSHLLEDRWVLLPLVTTGFALSVNITDWRVQLLRTSRSLFLTLAAWLLPVLAALTLVFLLALPFTGMSLLWATHRASAALLSAALMLTVLINAAYGDGTPATGPGRVLRLCVAAGAVLLLPLTAMAAYGDFARVAQYGWTPPRLFAAADILVIGIYALGYMAALIPAGAWMHRLQVTNIAAAFVVVALILVLWSPVADPVRLSVNDQVARLRRGAVAPEKFDYAFLRRAGRYGRDALHDVQSGWTDAPDAMRQRVTAAMARVPAPRVLLKATQPRPLTAEERARQIKLYPMGATLPSSLAAQASFGDALFLVPKCLTDLYVQCEAVLADVLGQGRPQLLFFTGFPTALLEQKIPGGAWEAGARIDGPIFCKAVIDALKSGAMTQAPAIPAVTAGGATLTFPPANPGTGCN
jgi:hypothetical protein